MYRNFLLLAALSATAAVAQAGAESKVSWKKITVERVFRSEGVAIADVNKDGKTDVLVGDVWYEAPDWKPHVIRKKPKVNPKGYDPHNYSQCFACWAEDINKDGWPDLIAIGFPGEPCHWYENPKNEPGLWQEHKITDSACNETPTYVDLFGKGQRVLLMGWQPPGKGNMGQLAYFTPGAEPTKPWTMVSISGPSEMGKEVPGTQRYSHGLGIGDVNGDGRSDVLCTGGWWEQPSVVDGKTPWTFHKANLGAACADMHVTDLDGDGKNDVVSTSAHGFGFWWYKQLPGKDGGAPNFAQREVMKPLFSQSHALHFVDIDGDGLKDLVTGRRWWAHGPKGDPGSDGPAVVYWFKAKKGKDGTITYTPQQVDDDSGIGTQFQVADFNGDGLPDIIVSNKKGVHVFLQERAALKKE